MNPSITLDPALVAQAEKLAQESGHTLEETLNQLQKDALRRRELANAPQPLLSDEEFNALGGTFKLSLEDEKRDYREIVAEERAKKYGLL